MTGSTDSRSRRDVRGSRHNSFSLDLELKAKSWSRLDPDNEMRPKLVYVIPHQSMSSHISLCPTHQINISIYYHTRTYVCTGLF